MSQIRRAAVAGRFYPDGPNILRNNVEALLSQVEVPKDDLLARAYVVPHAGYRFSGPIAAKVYARLRHHAARIGHVVLVGPSHFVPLDGLAASPADAWATPLGDMPIRSTRVVPGDAEPHRREHSLEVQVPFLQVCLPQVEITPVAVGNSTIEDTAANLDRLVDDDSLLLCSTDLSHFHDQSTAMKRDRATADAVLAGDARRIGTRDACGVFALRGTVAWAAHHGLTATELGLATSADTYGSPDRVVGYSAFSFR